jgi:hypothetical protein
MCTEEDSIVNRSRCGLKKDLENAKERNGKSSEASEKGIRVKKSEVRRQKTEDRRQKTDSLKY